MTRVALVTGAVGGIGRATAELFGKSGWRVIGVDVDKPAEDHTLHRFIQADLSDPGVPARLLSDVEAQEGRLDTLVNNAAVQIRKPALDTSVEEWDRVLHTNLRAPFLLVKAALPLLRQSRGAVVNVASVHAFATTENAAAYAASKGGLVALTRALALEAARDGVRVNAVVPGAVDTPMLADGVSSIDAIEVGIPVRRVAQPLEAAESILFLSQSERSGFVTGQTLVVDGGVLAQLATE